MQQTILTEDLIEIGWLLKVWLACKVKQKNSKKVLKNQTLGAKWSRRTCATDALKSSIFYSVLVLQLHKWQSIIYKQYYWFRKGSDQDLSATSQDQLMEATATNFQDQLIEAAASRFQDQLMKAMVTNLQNQLIEDSETCQFHRDACAKSADRENRGNFIKPKVLLKQCCVSGSVFWSLLDPDPHI